jgi:putative hydrolase of the HAD superfamily
MAFSNIEHIVFDLDHTLWDFNKNSRQALVEIFKNEKLGNNIDSFDSFHKEYIRINDLMWAEYRLGKLKKEDLRYGRFRKTLSSFNIENSDLADRIGEEYIRTSPYQKNLIPGTLEILDYLSNKYVLHILTNGFLEIQHVKMKNTKIDGYFKTVTCSEELGVNKPNIEIFKFKEEKIKINSDKILMIGDSLEADVYGSMNAEWKAIHFGEKPDDKEIISVQNLIELRNFL